MDKGIESELGVSGLTLNRTDGFAEVYQGFHSDAGRVVVTVVSPERGQSIQDGWLDPLRSEAVDQLENVQKLIRVGRTNGGSLWFAETYAGASLKEVSRPSGQVRLVVSAIAAAAEVIHLAHRAGVVHSCIRPESIFVDGDTVSVGDFALGPLLGYCLEPIKKHSAPEVLSGRSAPTVAADVYSLGSVLGDLLESHHVLPMLAVRSAGSVGGSRASGAVVPSYEVLLAGIVGRAVEKNPRKRHRSAQDFAAALGVALDRMPENAGGASGALPPWGPTNGNGPNGLDLDFDARHDRLARFSLRQLVAASALVILAGLGLTFCSIADRTPESEVVTISPDGTGDYADIESAIAGAPDNAIIEVAAGTYKFVGPIAVNRPVNIIGAGRDVSVVEGFGPNPVIIVEGSALGLKDVTVRYSGGASADVGDVIRATDSELTVKDARITGGGGDGMRVLGGTTGSIEGTQFQGNKASGLSLSGNASLVIKDSEATENDLHGFLWSEASSGEAIDNKATRNGGSGFSVADTARPALTANRSNKNTVAGYEWVGAAGGTARDNFSTENTGFGYVFFDESQPLLISARAVRNVDNGFAWFNRSTARVDKSFAIGNSAGFSTTDSASSHIVDSTSEGNLDSGFLWAADSTGSGSGNTAKGNDLHGFTFYGAASPEIERSSAVENGEFGYFVLGEAVPILNGCEVDGNESGPAFSLGEAVVLSEICAATP